MSTNDFIKQTETLGDASNRRIVWVVPHSLTDKLHASARIGPARALQSLGWDVTFVAARSRQPHLVADLHVHEIPLSSLYFIGQTLFHLRALLVIILHWWQYDVVFFHQTSILWFWPLGILRLLPRDRRPLIVMDTRDLVDVSDGTWRIRLRMKFYRFAYQTIARIVDGQTTITPRMAELIEVSADKLLGVWPSGVYVETFAKAREQRTWPVDGAPIHLIYIGILLPRRNPLPLSKAVARANEEGMRFELSLVGSGRSWAELELFALEAGGCIRLIEPVPHEQIPDLLVAAHVGVTSLPDPGDIKYAASSPIKLFEYMAAGLPVLATTSVCHTDVVQEGKYAFWVDDVSEEAILEALRQLWQERANLTHLGDEAARAAQDWSWYAAGRKLSAALDLGLDRLRAPIARQHLAERS